MTLWRTARADETPETGGGAESSAFPIDLPPSESSTVKLTPTLDTGGCNWGASVTFYEVSLSLPLPSGRGNERLLLDSVTGHVPAATMYALMGSSGAGKTTLLDVASMRRSSGRLTGGVLIGGAPVTRPLLKRITAYVQQEDALCGWCSIEETLLFTAYMKLKGLSITERSARVDDILQKMGLLHARKTLVGSRLVRGCSGGERKRVSVAAGLLGKPKCMFIDEPTSGLDSKTAQGVMSTLKAVNVATGTTMLVTIHQPSLDSYRLFDGLVLLHRGALCYFGEGGEAPCAFLEQQGFPYRHGFSLTEFFLDTICVVDTPVSPASTSLELDAENGIEVKTHSFAAAYAQSSLCAEQQSRVESARQAGPMESVLNSDSDIYANTMLREIFLLLRFRGIVRFTSPLFVFSRIVLLASLGALFASFFYSLRLDIAGIAAAASVLFLVVSTPTYLGSMFVQDLISDREVYTREFHDAYYRVFPYVLVKTLVEIPAAFVSSLVFTAIIYPSIGLRSGGPSFLFFALATAVNVIISALIGFTLSSVVPGEIAPLILLPCFATLNTLVAGMLVTRSTLPVIWRWLYTASYEQWLWGALMVNQFDGTSLPDYCAGHRNTVEAVNAVLIPIAGITPEQSAILTELGGSTCLPIPGDAVLSVYSLHGRSRWASLGYASLSIPVLFMLFFIGVRSVRHEHR